MKKIFAFISILTVLILTSAVSADDVKDIILQAQFMPLEELAVRAIGESNGKAFFGLGNSSRGTTAIENFISYMQTIDPAYNLDYDWQAPKNNRIFEQLAAESLKDLGTFSVVLIQDGNQIESKMVQTGILDTFIPLGWAEATGITAGQYTGYLPLLTVNKVFEYNNRGEKVYDNVWDFVAEGEHGLFMDIDSEIVGKNFLIMLTTEKYADGLQEAFEELPEEEKPYFRDVIEDMEQDAKNLGLSENGKYALAWIKLWVESYNPQADDDAIINSLADESAKDEFGLLVYSKFRTLEESAYISKNNVGVAAFQEDYSGFGGYGYNCYLFVTDNCPLPWTACALIAFLTEKTDGFSAWGKDIGAYTSNPVLAAEIEEIYHHQTGGYDENGELVFPVLNDHDLEWWLNEADLVLEDPEYCADKSFTVGAWIEMLDRYRVL